MCRVTMGHRWVTIGHLRVTVGHPLVTMGHLRLTIGYLKATVVHIRVTLGRLTVTVGHLRVTVGYFFSISKHKANTTELHHKVRQTCFDCFLDCFTILLRAHPSCHERNPAGQGPGPPAPRSFHQYKYLPLKGHIVIRGSFHSWPRCPARPDGNIRSEAILSTSFGSSDTARHHK